jgi:hypothetical protein
MRFARGASAIVVLASSLGIGVSAAVASSASSGGAIQVWAVPGQGAASSIVITGAIGDYGTATSTTKSGFINNNGNFVNIILQKGTLKIDSSALNAKTNNAQPNFNAKTCAFWFTASNPVTIIGGSGAYKGAHGTVRITISFAGVGQLVDTGKKKGQCDQSQSTPPVAQFATITGTGTVGYSS